MYIDELGVGLFFFLKTPSVLYLIQVYRILVSRAGIDFALFLYSAYHFSGRWLESDWGRRWVSSFLKIFFMLPPLPLCTCGLTFAHVCVHVCNLSFFSLLLFFFVCIMSFLCFVTLLESHFLAGAFKSFIFCYHGCIWWHSLSYCFIPFLWTFPLDFQSLAYGFCVLFAFIFHRDLKEWHHILGSTTLNKCLKTLLNLS